MRRLLQSSGAQKDNWIYKLIKITRIPAWKAIPFFIFCDLYGLAISQYLKDYPEDKIIIQEELPTLETDQKTKPLNEATINHTAHIGGCFGALLIHLFITRRLKSKYLRVPKMYPEGSLKKGAV